MKSPLMHLVFVIVLGIAAVGGYVFWYSMVSDESARVAGLQDQIISAHETVNRIASARAMLAEIAGDEAKMHNYFVSESDVVSFINDLQARGLAEKSTVSVLSVSTGGTSARPTLTLSLTIKGTFDAVMRTIGAIEYAPYDISIPMLSVEQDAKNTWRADLSLVAGSRTGSATTTTP